MWRLAVMATLLLSPTAAWACSGPGAGDVIARNIALGWLMFGISLAIAVPHALALYRRGMHRHNMWLISLVAAHPGWWMAGNSGDCGFMLHTTSIYATGLVMAVCLAGAFRLRLTS